MWLSVIPFTFPLCREPEVGDTLVWKSLTLNKCKGSWHIWTEWRFCLPGFLLDVGNVWLWGTVHWLWSFGELSTGGSFRVKIRFELATLLPSSPWSNELSDNAYSYYISPNILSICKKISNILLLILNE